jgi:hypothetical protein
MAEVDWAAAWNATGTYLNALCQAAGVDRRTLDRQDVDVMLMDNEGNTLRLPFSAAIEDFASAQVDDTEVTDAARDFQAELDEEGTR